MEKNRRFEAPGTRLVFWVYAGFAWAGGLLLFGFGPWLGVPHLQGPLLRVAGTAVVASGLFSAAMAQVADDNARRRGMLWFAAGHFLVWLCLFVEYPDVWNSRAAEKVMTILFIPTLAFLFFRQLDNPDPSVSAFQTLFGGGARPARPVRPATSEKSAKPPAARSAIAWRATCTTPSSSSSSRSRPPPPPPRRASNPTPRARAPLSPRCALRRARP